MEDDRAQQLTKDRKVLKQCQSNALNYYGIIYALI